MEHRILEIRTYRLTPGRREAFHEAMRNALPMLARHQIRVIRYGPSLVEDDHYVLMRAYRSIEERDAQLEGFYGSDEWLQEHDPTVTPLLQAYHTVLLAMDPAAIDALAA